MKKIIIENFQKDIRKQWKDGLHIEDTKNIKGVETTIFGVSVEVSIPETYEEGLTLYGESFPHVLFAIATAQSNLDVTLRQRIASQATAQDTVTQYFTRAGATSSIKLIDMIMIIGKLYGENKLTKKEVAHFMGLKNTKKVKAQSNEFIRLYKKATSEDVTVTE